jgi:dihydrofolate synthase/folylpolyglutamate synthase
MSVPDATDYAAVVEHLCQLRPRVGKLGLDRMRVFAARLGYPERTIPCVHIAGTNGKGSVAAMMEAILRAAKWKVGLFTSPHLVHLGERIQVNRRSLPESAIIAYTRKLDAVADEIERLDGVALRPSFFEYMTAMAWLEFREAHCDIAVIEVGLGGEFDATNIVTPEISIITSIGLDHCEWLGKSIEEVATAKAGIIKSERPVVIGRLPQSAECVVRNVAARHASPVLSIREVFGETSEGYPETGLEGDYQRWNAATATLAARNLGKQWRIEEAHIREGLLSVSWPGRWQRTHIGARRAVLDASHNEEGAFVLDVNLAALRAEVGRSPVVVVGALGADRALPLIRTVCRHAAHLYLVVPNQPRACSYAELEAAIPANFDGSVTRADVAQLFPGGDICTAGSSEDVIVVTGSIYLLGEVMTRLSRKSPR